MAAEWWYPPSDQNARMPSCGHAIPERDFPRPFLFGGHTLAFVCPICQLMQVVTPSNKVRDGVPNEDLGWGAARCKTRIDFVDLATVQVTSFNLLRSFWISLNVLRRPMPCPPRHTVVPVTLLHIFLASTV